jgi:hypothetical protein
MRVARTARVAQAKIVQSSYHVHSPRPMGRFLAVRMQALTQGLLNRYSIGTDRACSKALTGTVAGSLCRDLESLKRELLLLFRDSSEGTSRRNGT